MSKTDSLLRLLAILRFTVPSNSSRTLNATQAYDVTSSGITLATATGTLLDKSVAVKSNAGNPAVGVGLSFMAGGTYTGGDSGFEKQTASEVRLYQFRSTSLWTSPIQAGAGTEVFSDKCDENQFGNCLPAFKGTATTLGFGGTSNGGTPKFDLLNKSKATNPNTFFYGAITVGTGDYKKWQGKYAVLKINTVTGKGVLRIYDDA